MNTDLPQHISEFADVAMHRLQRVGGPQAALRAETDDQPRGEAADALRDIGAHDLNVRAGEDDALAAAVLCQAAGATALPYPVVEQLLAIDGARLALINPAVPRVDHGDLPGAWIAADADGRRFPIAFGRRTAARLGPFLVPATLGESDGTVPRADVDLHLVLSSWRILGAMQRCLQIVREHVTTRTQFGKTLSEFQTVRFAVADADVAVRGMYELAKYTMSRSTSNSPVPPEIRSSDALVLRLKAIEAARQVLRTSHQLHGALGFCDESDISVIDRHVQPLIRLPLSGEEVALRLIPAIREGSLETLFSEAAFSESA